MSVSGRWEGAIDSKKKNKNKFEISSFSLIKKKNVRKPAKAGFGVGGLWSLDWLSMGRWLCQTLGLSYDIGKSFSITGEFPISDSVLSPSFLPKTCLHDLNLIRQT
jgi:hypothetical protein